jgi:hypothetical protein
MSTEDLIRADFRNFIHLMWRFLKLPKPTEVQYDIAHYLQHGPRRRMVEAFRGVGKSWLTAGYVLWRLDRDPNERVLVVSASKDRADAFSVFVKRCIHDWEYLQHLAPEPGMRDSNIAFDVGGSEPHQAPSVRSVGISGQLTGGRASIIVADDVETPKNAMTTVMREKLAEAVKEFDAVLVPGGEIVYLGTPQTEMSLYNSLPERGYEIRVWPARYPKDPDKYQGRLAPLIAERLQNDPDLVGQPTDPARFSHLDLLEREASYGRSGFALQFQLDTSLSDADRFPLKLSDLMVMGVPANMGPIQLAWGSSPEYALNLPNVGLAGDRYYRPMFIAKDYAPYTGVVMSIDPSGRGSDETGYAVVAMLHGFLFVLEAGGLAGGYDDATLETLARIAKRCGVNRIIVEANFGDGMFTKLLTPFLTKIHPCTTEEIKSSIQKEKRIIDTLEPVMNQHRLIIAENVVKEDLKTEDLKYQLFYQMSRITRDKGALGKDDRLDALAMAVAYWVEQMGQDTRKAMEAHLDELRARELEDFMGTVLGRPKQSTYSWMDAS